jgi:hypothetical protein
LTRDPISAEWTHRNTPGFKFTLVDTAGLSTAKLRRIDDKSLNRIDALAMRASHRAIELANVVMLVINVSQGVRDTHFTPKKRYSPEDRAALLKNRVAAVISDIELDLAKRALNEGRALVICVNQMDRIEPNDRAAVIKGLRLRIDEILPVAAGVPMITVSAKAASNLQGIPGAVVAAYRRWNSRVVTNHLNGWLQSLQLYRPHPYVENKPVRVKYMTQVNTRPPTFALFCNRGHSLQEEWLRMLGRGIREEFGLEGVGVRLLIRKSTNPYVEDGDRNTQTSKDGTITDEKSDHATPASDAKEVDKEAVLYAEPHDVDAEHYVEDDNEEFDDSDIGSDYDENEEIVELNEESNDEFSDSDHTSSSINRKQAGKAQLANPPSIPSTNVVSSSSTRKTNPPVSTLTVSPQSSSVETTSSSPIISKPTVNNQIASPLPPLRPIAKPKSPAPPTDISTLYLRAALRKPTAAEELKRARDEARLIRKAKQSVTKQLIIDRKIHKRMGNDMAFYSYMSRRRKIQTRMKKEQQADAAKQKHKREAKNQEKEF